MKRSTSLGGVAMAAAVTMATHAGLSGLSITDGIGGSFTDISGTGFALGLGDDGEETIASTIGNALFGAGDVRIGNNGGLAFTSELLGLSFTNASIDGASPAWTGGNVQSLLPYWDDLDSDNGDVYWEERNEDGIDVLIVQWNRPHFPGPGDEASFQVKVWANGGPALAQFLYNDTNFGDPGLDDGASATIGYQSADPLNNVQWSFDTAGAVSGGTVLSLIPAPGAMALLGVAGLAGCRRRRRL